MPADDARVEGNTRRAARGDEEAHLLPPAEDFDFDDSDFVEIEPVTRKRRCGWHWLAGPANPRAHAIKPLFPALQRLPVRFLDTHIPKQRYRAVAFALLVLFWFGAFAPLLWASQRPIPDGEGRHVVNLDCVDTLWARRNSCGPNGVLCQPFSNTSFAFRCPADCAGVQVWNPRAVGPVEVTYRPLVIGSDVYRGDSFVCGSAVHAGLINDRQGGCGKVSLVGRQSDYASVERNGLTSIGFDSYFPVSFAVSETSNLTCHRESREALLLHSVLFTATLSLFTASPPWFFFPTFIAGFAHVAFVSDQPYASFHNISVLPDHVSTFAERLLPALFCAVVLYQACVRRALRGLEAQIEKTFLWLGGFWFGALSNYSFGWLPIQRLRLHDLEQQPGAKLSLAAVVLVIALIAGQQIYYFWREGRLLAYLGLYGLFILGILLCLALPSVELRIHHYVVGLLLLPGTSMQTRPSLLYQGLLFGLFVNGVARWGFASVLETPGALRGDGTFASLLPVIGTPSISPGSVADALSTISLTWELPPPSAHMEAISVLVNDVERLRRFFAQDGGSNRTFAWARPGDLGLPEYFRFAFIRDGATLDYTKAGTWFANGTWTMPGQ